MDHLIQNLSPIARFLIPYRHQEGMKGLITHIMRLLGDNVRKVLKKVQKGADSTSCYPEYTGKVTGLSSCQIWDRGEGGRGDV